MLDWLAQHKELLAWLGIASAVFFAGSLVAVPVLIARIPADYFAQREPPRMPWQLEHPALRLTLEVIKNALGVALIAAGIAMLLLPGQGLLTIFLGLVLLEFPGKRALELRLVARPRVLRALNWIRRKAHRPPLIVGDGSGGRRSARSRADD